MKRAVLVTVLGGLASGVTAQSLSVHLSFDATDSVIGGIVTASVSASFTGQPDGAYLSSVGIDLIASSTGVYDVVDVAPVAWNNAGLGFDGQGVGSGSDVLGINASQFSLIPPVTAGSPILITTFRLIRVGSGTISYQAGVVDGAPFAFSVTGAAFSDQPVPYGVDVFTSDTLNGTPTPGALGMLGVCGLLAGRRRR